VVWQDFAGCGLTRHSKAWCGAVWFGEARLGARFICFGVYDVERVKTWKTK